MSIHKIPVIEKQLNKLQSLFKTDIRYLLKGTVLLGGGQAFAALSGLLLTIGLVTVLDQANYGLYTYILSLAGIVGAFSLSGMDTAVSQAVAKGSERMLIHGFWSKLRWGLPAGIITICIGGYYLYKDNETLGYSLVITGIFSPFLYAASLYGSYFNGKKMFKKLSIDNALRNAFISASVFIVAFITKDVVYIILAYFLSNTLVSTIRFILLARTLPAEDAQTHTTSISLGKHLSFMDFLSNVSMYIDKILIFQFLGATPLALYALALAPVKQLQSISKIIRSLVLPKFSARSGRELKKTMHIKIKIFYLVSIAAAILYCVFAQLFFIAIFPQYHEALVYSQVLSLGLIFMPCILHSQALSSLGKKRELYIFTIVKFVIKIVSLIVLVPLYGIWGAIAGFLLMHAIIAITLSVLFERASIE